MLPEITLLHRTISLYGVCTAVGAVLVLLRLHRYEKDCPLSLAGDIDLALFYALIGGAVGAKLLYLLTVLPALAADWRTYHFSLPFLRNYLTGGFVFYGGLFGYLLTLVLYAKHVRLPYAVLERPLLPSFVLFHAFGRIGCFCAGCCYGVPTDSFLGVTFTRSHIAPCGVPLFPVQLFEAAGEGILFFVLSRLAKQEKSLSLTGFYLLCYGVMRFVLEFFRGDTYRGKVFFLSLSQAISLAAIALGIVLLRRRAKNDRCNAPVA